MNRLCVPAIVLAVLLANIVSAEEPAKKTDADRLFATNVLPLLRTKCFGCHGDGKELESGLDMRTREGLLTGGDLDVSLVPGKPDESAIYTATLRTGDLIMPPKDRNKLTKEEIGWLRQWIEAGAPWPENAADVKAWSAADGVEVATSGGLDDAWTHRRYEPDAIWAYQPVKTVQPPVERVDQEQIANEIDAFMLARLQDAEVASYAPAADRRTLIRRASFDLTGLPPTPKQIEEFVADETPEAYARLIDRLLDSSRYGERWAQHWLDVVRYADTSGFSNDYERANAWRYRDYVIRSFNADKPYDRFILEQLAGDELDPTDPENLIATGFLRMGPWEHTGMSVAAVTRQLYLDDVTHAVGVTFLAQGMRCAKCHDHKFDPLPTRDYYRLQAVFAPVQFVDREVPYQEYEYIESFARQKKRTEALIADARSQMAEINRRANERREEYLAERGVKSINDLPEEERSNARFFGLSKLDKSLEKIYRKRIAYFERELMRYEPLAFSVYNGPTNGYTSIRAKFLMPPPEKLKGKLEQVHILMGGAIETPGELVGPGAISAIEELGTEHELNIPAGAEGRRLALARWIASPQNPLTARVMVNRVWQHHFGRGLVETPNNFGKMGARPTHPELLDWLASWFVEHDWSVKELHRLIMTSNVYRQSGTSDHTQRLAEVDSGNRLLGYYPPRRLTAEEIRDGMLSVTNELNPKMGGLGMFPEINWEVAKQPRHIMGSVAPAYQPDQQPEQRNRRTIYAFRIRTLADPMLEVFNRPGSDNSCEFRDSTTVTPQVFAIWNGQFAHDRSIALAASVAQESNKLDQQMIALFRHVLGRKPTDRELQLCREHYADRLAYHRQVEPKPVEPPLSVEREMVEELTGESFTWEEDLDAMHDYQSDLKPWDVSAEVRALSEIGLVLLNSNEFIYVR